MSKTISAELKAHMAENLTTLAACWRIERQDATEYFFTSHDVDLVIDGDTYEAVSGMLPKAMEQNRALAVDNLNVIALLESDKVAEADIAAGLFDLATLDVFVVNYEDLSMDKMYLAQGWMLGEVQIGDQTFEAEVRGKAQKLQQAFIELYSPDCRADLGDSHCGVDLADSAMVNWREGAVTAVTDRQTFTDTSITGESAEDIYAYGKLTWTGGGSSAAENLNDGFEIEVKSFDNDTQTFTLVEKMPYDINVGDTYEVTLGCDKMAATCKNRFNNLVNFRGEPFVPGFDALHYYKQG